MLETLAIREEGAVLFAEIAAPPVNLLGPDLVRDLVSLIQRAEADADVRVDLMRIAEYRQEAARLIGEASFAMLFRHLSASRLVTIAPIEGRMRAAGRRVRAGLRHADRFAAGVRDPEAPARIQAAMRCGRQTRYAELDFDHVLS
jgi:hypothetical protein